MAEESPVCGQMGRVYQVFWREGVAWVLVRCTNGRLVSLPWRWTNLPVPVSRGEDGAEAPDAALLSPAALLALVRHLHHRPDTATPALDQLAGGPWVGRQDQGDGTHASEERGVARRHEK
jgi:hypothetical protein